MSESAGGTPKFDPKTLQEVDVSKDYPMEEDERALLYEHNCYCQMAHINKYGTPIVTPMFYVVMEDGLVHLSSIAKHRHKVNALQANPKVSVTIHNDGSNAKRQKAILIIGKAEVSFDPDLLERVHWKIIDKYWWDLKDNEEGRQAAFKGIHTDLRAIIKIVPSKVMSWDFGKMVQSYERGVWFNEAYDMVKARQKSELGV